MSQKSRPVTVARLLPVALLALTVVGCGRAPLTQPTAAARTASAAQAASLSPDNEKVFANDLRRAKYWHDDAYLVMAVHTTGLNTAKIATSGNVFFSPEAYYNSKPAVFVARHYGIAAIAQYVEIPDYNGTAKGLQEVTEFAVKAEDAYKIAKAYKPAPPAAPGTPAQPPAAGQPTPAGAMKASAFFLNTRSFLVNTSGEPEWNLFANTTKFTVNAKTKVLLPPTPQVNPDDRLNSGPDVDLQRASNIWMPTNPLQDNSRKEPKPSN